MNINEGIASWKNTGGVLLDVRDQEDYEMGHIASSVNVPAQRVIDVLEQIPDKNTAIYIYCYMGRRSMMVEHFLKGRGYCNVQSIGGIDDYTGTLEK